MEIISEQIITIKEYINSRDINNNIDRVLYNKIKDNYGNKCAENGYILKESIEIIQRSIGEILTIDNKSCISYIFKCKCKVINVAIDDKLDVIINNINKMGIIAYYKIDDLTVLDNSPILVIIPYEGIKKKPFKIGDIINTIVKSTRIKFGSNQIQIIGELNNK